MNKMPSEDLLDLIPKIQSRIYRHMRMCTCMHIQFDVGWYLI